MISNSNHVRGVFPFSAIVGQDPMKLSLLLNAVYPAIGGVLIRGEKGTAKSTAVRGLSRLLPSLTAIKECIYRCDPDGDCLCFDCIEQGRNGESERQEFQPELVDLPLGATEDMVCGSIDFEKAMLSGKASFMPGILAKANRGILYIDEVNLLDDHLVDSIIDVAESNINIVEREGLSIYHPSSFMLVGTMNPEEGQLRPQILDRFGLAVQVSGESDPELRVELLKRRESYDQDNAAFEAIFFAETESLKSKIKNAAERVAAVVVPPRLLGFIAEITSMNNVAGHRADITLQKAACAYAAFAGRTVVTAADISAVAPLVLLHRTRDTAPPQIPSPPNKNSLEQNDQQESSAPSDLTNEQTNEDLQPQNDPANGDKRENPNRKQEIDERDTPDNKQNNEDRTLENHGIGKPFAVQSFKTEKDHHLRTGSGRRSRTRSANKQGRYVKSSAQRRNNDLALDATLRAAAPFQKYRRLNGPKKLAIHIQPSDIREKIRERRMGNFLLFIVDASGSMGAYQRMVATKAAILSLLLDAYQQRDKVGMVIFRGRDSVEILPPTGSIETAGALLAELSVGGRTPISAGLLKGAEVLERTIRKDPSIQPLVILLTDGKANAGLGKQPPHQEALDIAEKLGRKFTQTRFIVIDTENPGGVRLNLASDIAKALGANYFQPDDIRAEDLIKIAKENL